MAVTLLGHGSAGATCVMLHLTSAGRTETASSHPLRHHNYFGKVILMSGTILSPWSFQVPGRQWNGRSVSQRIVKQLTCDSSNNDLTLACLQQKSVSDLLRAFENVYQVLKTNDF